MFYLRLRSQVSPGTAMAACAAACDAEHILFLEDRSLEYVYYIYIYIYIYICVCIHM